MLNLNLTYLCSGGLRVAKMPSCADVMLYVLYVMCTLNNFNVQSIQKSVCCVGPRRCRTSSCCNTWTPSNRWGTTFSLYYVYSPCSFSNSASWKYFFYLHSYTFFGNYKSLTCLYLIVKNSTYYRKNILHITQPFQYRLQLRFAVIFEAHSRSTP